MVAKTAGCFHQLSRNFGFLEGNYLRLVLRFAVGLTGAFFAGALGAGFFAAGFPFAGAFGGGAV